MTAAVLPATNFMSMPLTSSDRHGDYYPPTHHVQHHIGENAHQAYFGQKANDFRLAGPPQLNTDPRALPPGSAHAYTPIHASPYTSSPASAGPSSAHHVPQYGPVSNSSAHAPTSHPVYVDSQSRPYVHSHHPASAYAHGVSPEMAGAGNMMKPPHYPQLSPIATLPSPSMYGRPQQYSWTPTSYSQQHNYVHQPGALSQRASFSVPQSASTPTYSRYSQPSTPVVPREASAMYTQLPSNIPHITIPRQPTVGTYHSPAGTGPPSGKDTSPTTGSDNNANGAAAPGPIPATIPKILQDSDGVQRIVFEYSKDKHRTTYQIRCDTNTVDVDALPLAFKEANLVYPRAYRKENYGGNRYSYESECNNIGWALTHLNPELRENRGATQRAVDSWRNSSSDPKMRSRRVRRQAKQQKRVSMQQQVQQASTQAVGAGKSGEVLATQRALGDGIGAAKDSHQYQLPAMKSEDDLKDVSTTTSLPLPLQPSTTESRYSTAHLQQTQYMPQDEHAGGSSGGGGMMVHSTYNAAQEYGGGQHQQHAHAQQGEYGATSYATQAGATQYGQYTVGSG